jgi:methionyl-tRNA synthetase
MISPFLPATAIEIERRLGIQHQTQWTDLFQGIAPGTLIAKGAPLFPRLAPPAPAA